ncbi:AAA family ATPase [Moorella sulfitireducens]|uniref:AAA family ATPase n=1 Tax=Neomoorella sulfitireducens TaxID=2972948 RepID=UPI0021ABF3BB|nr:ATP-binding protein [Moorella sulfitireducens]
MPGKLFPIGGPVAEEDIVDREDFITSLITRLSEGQSVMLYGPRRIGKTSLAHEVLRQLKIKGFYIASVDLFRLSSKRDLAVALINACLENRTGIRKTIDAWKDRTKTIVGTAKLAIKLQDLELDLGLSQGDQSDEALLDYALNLPGVLAKRDKKPVVILFDEFQDASRVAGTEIYKKMRSYFQNQEDVAYLFLGSKGGMMKTLFADKKEAFYRFATILPIPSIPETAWVEYIAKKFRTRGITSTPEAIQEITRKTGGHPQDTMVVCSELYYALLEAGQDTISLEIVRLGYDRALLTLAPIYDELLDDLNLSFTGRQVLKRIATGTSIYSIENANPNEIKRTIDHLLAKTVIEKKGRGSYAFVEPMFRDYVLREFF